MTKYRGYAAREVILFVPNDKDSIINKLEESWSFDHSSIVVQETYSRIKETPYRKGYSRVCVNFYGRYKTLDERAMDKMRDLC